MRPGPGLRLRDLAAEAVVALLVQAVATQRMASVAEDGSSEAAEKLEAAYGLLRRAIKLDAGFVDAHAHAADICIAQQRLEEATEHLRLATGWGLDAQVAPASVARARSSLFVCMDSCSCCALPRPPPSLAAAVT